jgi:F-type H+-transporting ATPase subunit b
VVSVAIDWTLIAQLITFLVLMFILNRILFRPILAILKERENIYETLKRKAQDARTQLEQGEREEGEVRAGALSEGAKLQGTLRNEGQNVEKDILEQAQKEAAEKLEAARAGLQRDVEAARVELRDEARVLSHQMASKILKRELPLAS